MGARPRLLFLITEDWYFWSHRLDLARGAQRAGYEISIATRVQEHGERIRREGFRLYPIRLLRRSRHPVSEFAAILQLVRLYRHTRPHIVHHVAMKPILYGSVAARIARVPIVINALAGLGYAFAAERPIARVLKICLKRALKPHNSVVVFQNAEDRTQFIRDQTIHSEQARVIAGSGVDTNVFVPTSEVDGIPIVMLASRMLWDKGVSEFIEAARLLKQKPVTARFVLVGRTDDDNPASIAPEQLQRWQGERLIEWWQHREDMPAVLGSAAVVVLPSYREGLPKVLVEAAACGKAMIASDVPGCREIVRPGINGILVPPREPVALAAAIERLLLEAPLRMAMGAAGREIAVKEFSVERIVGEFLDLYNELLIPHQTTSRYQGVR
ncbi:MAG: glycosyltransferase family 4 protein [Nitrospiraceae bacterium]